MKCLDKNQLVTLHQSATKSNCILDENSDVTHPQWIHLEKCGVKSVNHLKIFKHELFIERKKKSNVTKQKSICTLSMIIFLLNYVKV